MTLQHYLPWLALAAAIASPAAYAALGGDIASINQDRRHIKAAARVLPGDRYTVHELITPAGIVVREYAAGNGKVFAVAWSGPRMPDLRQLLGDYFDAYISDSGAQHGGHARRSVERSDLVVHSVGRLRAFSGKAYLPSALPAGVTINELQ